MDPSTDPVSWIGRAIYIVLPFMTGTSCLFAFRSVAYRLGVVDRPTERKAHVGEIPLVGGPAIFVAILVASVLLVPAKTVLLFLALGLVLLALGLVDDLLDLPASFRAAVQMAVGVAVATLAGLEINSVGNIAFMGNIELHGLVAIVFTAICTVGVINSVNMIDGLDGLAGTLLGISFAGMFWLAWTGSNWVDAKALVIVIGSLGAFLLFNARLFLPRAVVFLGDSGSMLLGYMLVWYFIRLTQGADSVMSPVVAGWLFGLPLLDTVSVILHRLSKGRSPFRPGRDHLHHQLLDSGLSVNRVVLVMASIQAAMVLIGVLCNPYPALEPWLFCAFVLLVLARFVSNLSRRSDPQVASNGT